MTQGRLFIVALFGAYPLTLAPRDAAAQAPAPRAKWTRAADAHVAAPVIAPGPPVYTPGPTSPAAGPPAYPQGQPSYVSGQPAYPTGQPAYPSGPPAYPPEAPVYPQVPAPVMADDGSIVEPAPAPAPEPAAPEPARAPAEPVAQGPAPGSYEGKIAASPYRRTGFVFGGGIGTRFCLTSYCTAAPEGMGVGPGFQARLLFEYRFIRYLSAGLTFGFAYHKILREGQANADPLTVYKENGFGWNMLATLTAYPLPFSRFDPYVGVGLGFAQQREKTTVVASGTSSANQNWYNRGVLRLSFGLDIFVTPKFSLGPRLDLDRGFGGNFCAEESAVAKSCARFPEGDRDLFARWVSVMIDFKGHF